MEIQDIFRWKYLIILRWCLWCVQMCCPNQEEVSVTHVYTWGWQTAIKIINVRNTTPLKQLLVCPDSRREPFCQSRIVNPNTKSSVLNICHRILLDVQTSHLNPLWKSTAAHSTLDIYLSAENCFNICTWQKSPEQLCPIFIKSLNYILAVCEEVINLI